jgi:hypothetical protein
MQVIVIKRAGGQIAPPTMQVLWDTIHNRHYVKSTLVAQELHPEFQPGDITEHYNVELHCEECENRGDSGCCWADVGLHCPVYNGGRV